MRPVDAFLAALDDLEDAIGRTEQQLPVMRERIAAIRAAHAEGTALRDIVEAEERPLVVQSLTEVAELLDRCGHRVRRNEALALREEGLTMDQIARHFGVSRQRISTLLRPAPRD